MKTRTILKSLALAMLMPAMLLTTACSNSDNEIINGETANTKGYTLPVTVNVTREGDATTRATFDGSKLSFSTGDKLFICGQDNTAGSFKGVLSWVSGGTFSGSINTQNEYTGTADALLTDAAYVTATLLPAGYESYAFLSIEDETDCSGWINMELSKAFAPTKKAAVEQFSFEFADSYSSGFALAPENAIVSFTISGLAANTEVAVLFKDAYDTGATPVNVTTDASGVATFAVAVNYNDNIDYYTLTVDGKNIALPAKTAEKGHIYKISRSMPVITWNSSKVAGISINEDPEENSFESDGITVAAFGDSGANFTGSKMSVGGSDGYFTFTSSVGNIKKIEINYTGDVYGYEEEPPVGWSLVDGTFTWSGTPATSVTLPSTGYSSIEGITSIVFTLE